MDYEKKYKEAQGWIEKIYPTLQHEQQMEAEAFFPELKESEDERIKKWLIYYFKEVCDNVSEKEKKGVLAWLEKQGEQKPFDYENANVQQKDFAPKAEPKFHEGEWVIHQGTENIYQVVTVIDNQYQLKYGDNYTIQNCADVDRCARLWNVAKDAKDGDVLATTHDNGIGQIIFIFKRIVDDDMFCYCLYDSELSDKLCFDPCLDSDFIGGVNGAEEEFLPATKEQRDLLFQKMKEAGYEWDAEKKELMKIVDKEQIKKNLQDNSFRRMFEQKPTEWSEEDECCINQLIIFCENCMVQDSNAKRCANFLKSLKERVLPQPMQEWSGEDEISLKQAIYVCHQNGYTAVENWLKSLRPQNKWKPSEEQMEALKYSTYCPNEQMSKVLFGLYQDLKKLMEE